MLKTKSITKSNKKNLKGKKGLREKPFKQSIDNNDKSGADHENDDDHHLFNEDKDDQNIEAKDNEFISFAKDDKPVTKTKQNIQKIASVWEDPDDQQLEFDISKVARLRKLRKTKEETIISGEEYHQRLLDYYQGQSKNLDFYKWTNQNHDYTDSTTKSKKSELESLLTTNLSIYETGKGDLPENIIKISKLASLSQEERHKAVLQSIDFHSNNQMFITGALDKTIKIYNIAKSFEKNKNEIKLIKTLYTKSLPITHAKYIENNNEILSCGTKKYLLSFDTVKNKFEKISPSFMTLRLESKNIDGMVISPCEDMIAIYGKSSTYLMILEAKTKQLLFELKMNSEISSCSFTMDSKNVIVSTIDGNIYQWDLLTRKVLQVFHDSGSIKTLCIGLADKYMASGTSSGIVNVYEFDGLTKVLNKKPLKDIENLTTSIDNVKFNNNNEILAITTRWKKNGIRLIHLPSMSVFSNWPNMQTKLSFINKIEFSHDNRYLAIGNDLGNVILYEFDHYNSGIQSKCKYFVKKNKKTCLEQKLGKQKR